PGDPRARDRPRPRAVAGRWGWRGRGSSVVAESVDELPLVHLGAALDADLPCLVEELILGAILVVAAPPPSPSDLAPPLARRRVGDPSGLLLAHPVVPERFVLLGV